LGSAVEVANTVTVAAPVAASNEHKFESFNPERLEEQTTSKQIDLRWDLVAAPPPEVSSVWVGTELGPPVSEGLEASARVELGESVVATAGTHEDIPGCVYPAPRQYAPYMLRMIDRSFEASPPAHAVLTHLSMKALATLTDALAVAQ